MPCELTNAHLGGHLAPLSYVGASLEPSCQGGAVPTFTVWTTPTLLNTSHSLLLSGFLRFGILPIPQEFS